MIEAPLRALMTELRARGLLLDPFDRGAVERAVRRRVSATRSASFEDYSALLHADDHELARLGHEVIVGYTGFFRDAEAWRFLADEVLPRLRAAAGVLRVWSAGCASGEEPYTLAILLAELVGIGEMPERALIVGTDVDREALKLARRAVYPKAAVRSLPGRLRRRYFERYPEGMRPRGELRRAVHFVAHDLRAGAAFSSADVVVCRHTLMYLDPTRRASAVRAFHAALRPRGVLFVESTDTLSGEDRLFERLDERLPIFLRRG